MLRSLCSVSRGQSRITCGVLCYVAVVASSEFHAIHRALDPSGASWHLNASLFDRSSTAQYFDGKCEECFSEIRHHREYGNRWLYHSVQTHRAGRWQLSPPIFFSTANWQPSNGQRFANLREDENWGETPAFSTYSAWDSTGFFYFIWRCKLHICQFWGKSSSESRWMIWMVWKWWRKVRMKRWNIIFRIMWCG